MYQVTCPIKNLLHKTLRLQLKVLPDYQFYFMKDHHYFFTFQDIYIPPNFYIYIHTPYLRESSVPSNLMRTPVLDL